jgi:hypothetical protein
VNKNGEGLRNKASCAHYSIQDFAKTIVGQGQRDNPYLAALQCGLYISKLQPLVVHCHPMSTKAATCYHRYWVLAHHEVKD